MTWYSWVLDLIGILSLVFSNRLTAGAVYRLNKSARTAAARRALCWSNANRMSTDLLRKRLMMLRRETSLKPRNLRGKTKYSRSSSEPVSYTHLRAHETGRNLVCRLLLE